MVRGESLGLAEDLEALGGGLVERGHHQVQVRRQCAHAGDLWLLRTWKDNGLISG